MSKRNYSQYYKNNNTGTNAELESELHPIDLEPVEAIVDDLVEETVDAVIEETIVEPVVEPEADEVVEEVKPTMGMVIDCVKLNIRERPRKSADVTCVVVTGTELEIDMSQSTAEWYSVCTATGVKGYCMKSFISVKM